MSNEEKKKKKANSVDAESFEAGRVFALLKRKDPTLYQEIVNIMESEGKHPSDIIYEAFSLYRDYKYMIGVDPRALAYAIRVVQIFQQRAIELMAFSIEYYSKLMGAGPEQIAEIVAKRLEDELRKIRESGEEKKASGVPSTVREKLFELTANTMLKMVEAMLSAFARIGAPQAMTTTPTTTPGRRPKIVEKPSEEQKPES
jgi:hypothetical protein